MRKLGTVAAVALVTSAALAAAGALDTSFDSDGVVLADGTGDGIGMDVRAVVTQSDGKPVAVGSVRDDGTWRLAVRRFGTDGSEDASYGSGGLALPLAAAVNSIAFGAYVDSDGRLLVTGRNIFDRSVQGRGNKTTTQRVSAAVVVRLTADGDLDTSFGTNGVVHVESTAATATTGINVRELSDGDVLVSGYAGQVTDPGSGSGKGKNGGATKSEATLLFRLDASGSLDTGFGSGGVVIDNVTTGDEYVVQSGMAVQSSGKVVVGVLVRGAGPGFVRRYTTSGALDTSFGTGGSVTLPECLWGPGLAVDAGDGLAVAYTAGDAADAGTYDGAVLRLTADGDADTDFASDGLFVTGLSGDDRLGMVAVLADGAVVAGGWAASGSATDAFALRLTSTGALDPDFGSGGIGDAVNPGGDDVLIAVSLAVDGNGDVLLAGDVHSPQFVGFVARYDGD